jgi:predicted phage tail protein
MTKKLVRGSKGGGKGGGGGAAAVEATDSLHSKQFAQVLDLISEGPIVGLVNGAKSVYLNETPLQNTDGSFNFKDVAVNWTTGTQSQLNSAGARALTAQYGFDAVRAPNAVNVIVPKLSPVVKTINAANVSTLIVTVSTPTLLSRDPSNGNTNPSSIALTIDLQSAGGGFINQVTDTISGKTTSKYQRSYTIAVAGAGPWDVRVTKVTADSATQLLNNDLYFDDVTSVIPNRLTYPNSAIVAASIDSQQFQTIPVRAYDIKGLLVKIPSNYNPVTRYYTGTWDGTFSIAWTDNPAWCYYDMLTNSRYGLGDFIDATQVDKWSLYSIAQYCDVLVPSGVGGATEPRFTCNLYLQSPAEAYTVIQNMASIFRAITYWSTGAITIVQDSPASAAAQFTNANIIDGAFSYAGSSIKARHTVAQIAWNDPADFYRQKIEYVQDDDGVRLYGVKRADVVAFGCTSRGQANRLGKWLLYSEKAETETVTFKAGLDGFNLYPGAIIKTSDLNRAGQRMGGRIKSATTTSAVLDSAVTIAAGKTYSLSIVQPDGSVVKTAASGSIGQTTTLTLAALPVAPPVNSVFVFEANDLVAETWRIVGISQPEHHLVEITALKHDPTKFSQIELGQKFDTPIISALTARPAAPTGLAVITSPYTVGGGIIGLRATLSWQSKEGRFKVRWRQAGGIWQEKMVNESTIDIDNIDYTAYEFQVYAINSIGRESDVTVLNQSITVPAVVLPALTGLALEAAFTAKACKIKWNACAGATSYRVEVRDTNTNTARRIVNVGNALRFDYNSGDMRADGGPWRSLTFYVTPLGQFGSASAAAGTLAVTNPQVGAINGVTVTGGIRTVFVSYDTPSDADFVGVQVWLSASSVFTPDATTLVYDGNDSLLVFRTLADKTTALAGGTTYYVKIAGYDDFGKDSLTISGSIAVPVVASAPDNNSITAAMLQAGILDATKFASSIAPLGLVTSLPTVAGYTGPAVVYNSTDNKIYRLSGGAWTKAVDGGDVTAGTITAGQIQAGAIGATQIAAGAITTSKLAITSGGMALNRDPYFRDFPAAWDIYSGLPVPYNGAGGSAPSSAVVLSQSGVQTNFLDKEFIAIDPNKQYRLSGHVYTEAGNNRAFYLGIDFFAVSGSTTHIAGDGTFTLYVVSNMVASAGDYVLYQGTFGPGGSRAIPANARAARVGAYLNVGGTTGNQMALTGLRLEEVLPGTLIADGAITTSKMTAGSIQGDRITANTLNADRIITNSITAEKILANSLTANQIAAGTLTATQIAASSITADRLGVTSLSAVSARIGGTLTVGGGDRVEISDNRIDVINANVLRVRLGQL